ncbi:MAG: DUF3352 domain-containing protein [Candidatus Omnitrophota bacterium]
MKKIIAAVIIFLVLVMIGVTVFWPRGGQDVELRDLLPAEPLVYAEFDHLAEHLGNLQETQFAQALGGIDLWQALNKMDISQATILMIKERLSGIDPQQIIMVLKQLFRDRAALAVYDVDLQRMQTQPVDEILNNVVGVTKLSSDMPFMDLAVSAFAKMSQDINEETFRYRQYTIHLLSDAGKTFKLGYVRIGQYVVFGYGDQAARRAIDVLAETGQSAVSQGKNFTDAQGYFISGSDARGFVDLARSSQAWRNFILRTMAAQKASPAAIQQAAKTFDKKQPFRMLAFSGQWGQDQSRADAVLIYDRQKMPAVARRILAMEPEKSGANAFVPEGVLAYRWENTFNAQLYWEKARQQAQAAGEQAGLNLSADQVMAGLEQQMGFSMTRDVLPLLGTEVGGFITGLETENVYPFPYLSFFIKVNDVEKASAFLNQRMDNIPFLRFEQEHYRGITLRHTRVPLLTDVAPAYAFLNDYFLLSVRREDLKLSIDVLKGEQAGIQRNDVFQNPAVGADKPSNGIVYLDVRAMMKEMIGVAEWWDAWTAQEAAKVRAMKEGSRKRLADVEENIAGYQEQQKQLEEELSKLKENVVSAEEAFDEGAWDRLSAEYEKKQQIIKAAEERLAEARAELAELKAVEASEEQRLSAAGQRQLAFLERDIETKSARLEDMRNELEVLEDRRADLVRERETLNDLKNVLSKRRSAVGDVRDKIAAAREKRQELVQVSEELQQKRFIPDDQREVIVEELMKPGLNAFSHILWLTGKRRHQENSLRYSYFWSIQ